MNCCRKYLEYDPDYTRQLTPDNTRDDDDEDHYYSDETPTEDDEDEDEDMDDNEEEDYDMEEENTTESSDHASYDVDSDGVSHKTLGLPPYDTERSSENERAATPGVSKEVGKMSLDDVQPDEQEMEEEEEVQIVGEVQHQSDDEQPKVRKNRKPTQRRN